MKKIIMIICVLLIAGGIAAADRLSPKEGIDGLLESPQKYMNQNIALYGIFEEGAFDGVTVPGTLNEFTDSCDAVARVEVVKAEEYGRFTDELTCKVEKDFFKSLNYFGNKKGYITFLADKDRYTVGERYYLFLSASLNYNFPYIVYADEDYSIRVKLNDDGTLTLNPKIAGVPNMIYNGLVEDLDMEAYLKDFASRRSKDKIESPVRYSSYKEAVKESSSAVRVTVVSREENTKYLDELTVKVDEILVQGENYRMSEGRKGKSHINIPKEAVCEVGGEYVILLNDNNYVISPEYTIMSVEKYEKLVG